MPFSDLIDNHGFGISMALHKLQTQANIAAPVRGSHVGDLAQTAQKSISRKKSNETS